MSGAAERLPAQCTESTRDLTHAECVQRLGAHSFGRIAVSDGALPLIVPVSYALDGSGVVFRTDRGSLLERACDNTVVAFEIDGLHQHEVAQQAHGWSVVMVGTARVLFGADWLWAVELGLSGFGTREGSVFVKVQPGLVSGRAIEAVSTAAG